MAFNDFTIPTQVFDPDASYATKSGPSGNLIEVPFPDAITPGDMFLPDDFVAHIEDPGPFSVCHGRMNYTAEQIFDRFSTARSNPDNIYVVDTVSGSDSNSGASEASAFQTIGKAIVAGRAAAVPFKIRLRGGGTAAQDAIRNKNFRNGSQNVIYDCDVDFCVEFYNGQMTVGSHVDFAAPPLHTGASFTYAITTTSLDAVLDRARINGDGFYEMPPRVPFVASGDIPPGSWAYDGATGLIRRADGAPVTNVNTRIVDSVPNFRNVYNVSVGFFPETPGDVLILEGGGAVNAPFDVLIGSGVTDTTPRAVVAKNVRAASYAHHSNGSSRAFSVDGLHGLALFDNCMGAQTMTDGFNLHNARGLTQSDVRTAALTINCKSRGHGKDRRSGGLTNYNSCNGLTLHENVVGADIAGDYGFASGGCVRNIGTSKHLLAGTRMHDLGDRYLGSTTRPTALRTQDTAQAWTFRTRTPDMPPGTLNRHVASGAIFSREDWPSRGSDIGDVQNW